MRQEQAQHVRRARHHLAPCEPRTVPRSLVHCPRPEGSNGWRGKVAGKKAVGVKVLNANEREAALAVPLGAFFGCARGENGQRRPEERVEWSMLACGHSSVALHADPMRCTVE